MPKIMRWSAFLGYALLTTYVSLAPSSGEGLPLWDKAMHFTVYAIFLLIGSQLCDTRRTLFLLGAGILAYSGLLEVIQFFIGRDMSALDLLANGLGIAVATALYLKVSSPDARHPPAGRPR